VVPQAHVRELEPGVDMSKYVAGAIVVFNMQTRAVKWRQHLDLTSDSTAYRAYIYSSPVLVDLDRDGKLEIIAGTSAVRPCSLLAVRTRTQLSLPLYCAALALQSS